MGTTRANTAWLMLLLDIVSFAPVLLIAIIAYSSFARIYPG